MKLLTIAMLLLSIGLAYAGEKKGPIEVAWAVTNYKSNWMPNADGKTEIKWKNLQDTPIQIIEFEIVYEHRLSGITKTVKHTDILKTPALTKKDLKSVFYERGIMTYNVHNLRPIKIFFTDGTRWLDKDQVSTQPEAEEFKELTSKK